MASSDEGEFAEARDYAVALLKEFEGLGDGDRRTPQLEPYRCPAGWMTIGYGHVVRDAAGQAVADADQARALYPDGITPAYAEALLGADVASYLRQVRGLVTVPRNARQLAVLTSFAYNVGVGAFKLSTLRRRLNAGDYDAVPHELLRWTKVRGEEVRGLVRRRAAEAAAWRLATGGGGHHGHA